MKRVWDMIVIGAGPAGMSAALEGAKRGLQVLVLDRQSAPGGQIFRHAGENSRNKNETLGKDYARGAGLINRFKACGARLEQGNVWQVEPGRVYVSQGGASRVYQGRSVLIATGGMERPVPVPGWTLPGVMGAGACDVLFKSASLLPQGTVILCGSGPLILQTAAHLRHLGVTVAGTALTGNMKNYARMLPWAPLGLARPGYLAHGAALGWGMLRSGPCWPGAKEVRISGSQGDFRLSFHALGKERELRGATVLLHEGVIPESRITRLARLRHEWNAAQRCWQAVADVWGVTSRPGIYAAGDCAGVLGADAAMARGSLCGLKICRDLGLLGPEELGSASRKGRFNLARCRLMQPFLDAMFRPDAAMLQPGADATVCRCEELTAGELQAFVREGCASPDGLKAQARAGMGTCQGRMCAPAVAEMIAQSTGRPLEDLLPYHARPPLFPLSLAELADMEIPPSL